MSDETQGGPPKPPEENEPTTPTTPPEAPTGSGSPPPGPPPAEPGSQVGGIPESERTPAMWAHLGGAIITILCVCAPLAFIPPLVLFLTNRDKSRFASFHSLQALFLFGGTSVLNVLLGAAALTPLALLSVPGAVVINLAAGVYGIVIGMQANKGEWAEYVLIGELARGQLKS